MEPDHVCTICQDTGGTFVAHEGGDAHADHPQCLNAWFEKKQTCPSCRSTAGAPPTQEEWANLPFVEGMNDLAQRIRGISPQETLSLIGIFGVISGIALKFSPAAPPMAEAFPYLIFPLALPPILTLLSGIDYAKGTQTKEAFVQNVYSDAAMAIPYLIYASSLVTTNLVLSHFFG